MRGKERRGERKWGQNTNIGRWLKRGEVMRTFEGKEEMRWKMKDDERIKNQILTQFF